MDNSNNQLSNDVEMCDLFSDNAFENTKNELGSYNHIFGELDSTYVFVNNNCISETNRNIHQSLSHYSELNCLAENWDQKCTYVKQDKSVTTYIGQNPDISLNLRNLEYEQNCNRSIAQKDTQFTNSPSVQGDKMGTNEANSLVFGTKCANSSPTN
jgi:hypothetical protein